MPKGKVYLIGAGPGDPGLLTIKGRDRLRRAEVVVYDRLVHPSLLLYINPNAEIIYVGKASSAHTMNQDDINRLLVDKANDGKAVVRLKGGDPFVFGRGGEEAEVLAASGIEFEIVPGVTSAVAAPAYAGIPVTHRGVASSFAVITGHGGAGGSVGEWAHRGVNQKETLVFLMGVENLSSIVSELLKMGRDVSTPVALVRWGTWAEQETLVGTLGDIEAKVRELGFESPAVIVVGDVVKLRDKLRWFDNRPLFGKRVLVTRSREQASVLSELLREYGAEPVEFPVIKVSPLESFDGLDDVLCRVDQYDWLIFTSANGVSSVVDRLKVLGRDVRWLKGPKIGAIGPKTAESVQGLGVRVDFIPSEFVAEAVADQFPEDPSGKKILLLRTEDAREVLPEKLSERGAIVDVVSAYRTEIVDSDAARVKELIARGMVDVVTFTSSSTVRNFVKLLGDVVLPKRVTIACIGPITARTAEECGLRPDVVAREYTVEGLVAALVGVNESAGGYEV